MKAHGKGLGINLTDKFTNQVNKFKRGLANVSEGVPVVAFRPLRSWPARPHEREADLEAYRNLPTGKA